jgi:hypothetical protein
MSLILSNFLLVATQLHMPFNSAAHANAKWHDAAGVFAQSTPQKQTKSNAHMQMCLFFFTFLQLLLKQLVELLGTFGATICTHISSACVPRTFHVIVHHLIEQLLVFISLLDTKGVCSFQNL